MQPLGKEEILKKAEELAVRQSPWHFHLLTPDCLLNTTQKFVLVVEDKDDKQTYTYAADEKPMDTSEALLRLLHGNKIMDDQEEDLGDTSDEVQSMMQRAQELNRKGFFWHHHVLFPYCVYNDHPGQWTIVLEDPEKKEKLESSSDEEPKADMKIIEPAFYHQHVQR